MTKLLRKETTINLANKAVSEYKIWFALLALLVVFSIISPTFRSVENFQNLFNQQATLGIATIGMATVILTGGIDLSVGAVMAFSGVYYSNLIRGYLFTYMPPFMKVYEEAGKISPIFPEPFSLCLAIAIASLIGVVNGFAVSKFRAPAFVVTVSTMMLSRGIAYSMTSGQPIFSVPEYLINIGFRSFLGIPFLAIIWFLLVVVIWLFLKYSATGRNIYVVGGNIEAAKLTGINIAKTVIFSYWLSSILASFSGILLVGRMASADPRVASTTMLDAIAAAVIAGFSLQGGKGNLLNTIAGVLFIGLIINFLSILGIEFYTQQVIKGLIIILMVAIQTVSERGGLSMFRSLSIKRANP
ncbi:ABC transporter permease [Thermatribacter velox]|uniref:Autoinducer 2 import system permease protein LsrD n=1 Tax=Thermatribacter velox TaxID=3039681 RepID=A0ABZ2YAI2_9BACT